MSIILRAENIRKVYGEGDNKNQVLNEVNLTVDKGEFISIMGPSGCGKSTLLYILGGLDKPTSGRVFIDEKDIYQLKESELSKLRRSDIGFVFQFYNLVQNLSVEDNIMLPVVMSGKKAASYEDKLIEILDLVGLKE